MSTYLTSIIYYLIFKAKFIPKTQKSRSKSKVCNTKCNMRSLKNFDGKQGGTPKCSSWFLFTQLLHNGIIKTRLENINAVHKLVEDKEHRWPVLTGDKPHKLSVGRLNVNGLDMLFGRLPLRAVKPVIERIEHRQPLTYAEGRGRDLALSYGVK